MTPENKKECTVFFICFHYCISLMCSGMAISFFFFFLFKYNVTIVKTGKTFDFFLFFYLTDLTALLAIDCVVRATAKWARGKKRPTL